jgi:isopentenyl-diphosphate delta-isomerase
MEQNLILVNEHDQQTGVQGKVSVHKEGKLHRAFSILIFNNKGEILLQKRAHQKYHSGGLWTNACCSHPLPMEPIETTLQRRLMEEMGFK